MTSLTITQSTQQSEQVSSAVIEKLYRLALTSTVEDENSSFTMSLQGNISAPAAWEDSVTYLRAKFPSLTINIPEGKYYIRFNDSVVGEFCKTAYGDGTGVTKSDASVSMNTSQFWGRSATDSEWKASVTSLWDFQYFTNINISDSWIYAFPNATEIKFPDRVISFQDGTHHLVQESPNIATVDYGNCYFIMQDAFDQWNNKRMIRPIDKNNVITDWDSSLLPKQTNFRNIDLFNCWYKLQSVIFPEGVTQTSGRFYKCNSMQYIEYPTTIEYVGDWDSFMQDGSRSYVIVIKALTPPTMYYKPNNNDNNNAGWGWHIFPSGIYVPDSAVNDYKNVTPLTIGSGKYELQLGWVDQQIKDLIKPLSELPQAYLEMGTVTQEDINRVAPSE